MHISRNNNEWGLCVLYLSEGDRDASIQLNVIRQLGELVLLLLKCLQQTADLLLCQHNSAVVLQPKKRKKKNIKPNTVLFMHQPNYCRL